MKSRGIRNNNPGNLRRTSISWRGEKPFEEGDDPAFEIFISPDFGIRAMALDIKNDYTVDGLQTVQSLISAYAPKSENPNLTGYINYVADAIGADPNEQFNLNASIMPLIKAMIVFEQGENPYPDPYIRDALKMAGFFGGQDWG